MAAGVPHVAPASKDDDSDWDKASADFEPEPEPEQPGQEPSNTSDAEFNEDLTSSRASSSYLRPHEDPFRCGGERDWV